MQVPTAAKGMVFINSDDVKNRSNGRQTSGLSNDETNLLTTRSPKVPMTPGSNSLPEYILKSYTYPERGSQRSQTLIPLVIGFEGIYCFKEDLPLNLTILSSIFWKVDSSRQTLNVNLRNSNNLSIYYVFPQSFGFGKFGFGKVKFAG